ncbi:RES family NAD+ phosphorylase [Persicitalea jodogahamensis]|uniref:RES domain-containing protein n=1 Tax=Persicitalea jodogahamensis TaxID=402147 RepID=A0A8J3D365_9BACT|nr:RES family NAD+ phosphorylase [Persicitalea jodogahamensis]GHB74972.1 hypothetical protein GCM10007390_30840 [Persicitalea jodogahamensis]
MLMYRLVQAAFRHEPLSGEGAARYGGRWNPKGVSLLYTTESPALSLLEILVHLNLNRIPEYFLVTLEVPDSMRTYRSEDLPKGWQSVGNAHPLPSQTFLLEWLMRPDRLLVEVPSAILPIMSNYLINPRHPLFSDCRVVNSELLAIDERLYDAGRR